MLMWQDQRGTDHSLRDHGRDENAFFTFVERHGIPPVGGGLSLAHILYLQTRPARRARAHRGVRRGDGLRDRAPDRPDHRDAAQHVHVPALRQPHARPARATTTSSCELAGVDVDPAAAARPDRRRGRDAAARRRARARLCPRRRSCTRARTTPRPRRSRPARSHPGGPASRSARPACWSTRSTTSASTSSTRSSRCRRRTATATSCAPRTASAARCSSTCSATSCTRSTSSATTASADPFAALDAALGAHRPGAGGVMFLPWLGGALAPQGDGTMRGGFVNMSLETTRARPRARRRRRRRAQPALARCAPSRPSPGNAIDEIALVGGAARSGAVVPGPRRRARPTRDRARRARRRDRPRDRAPRAASATGAWSRADLDREPSGDARRFEPDPDAPQPLRRSSRPVRGCLRCPPPDQ